MQSLHTIRAPRGAAMKRISRVTALRACADSTAPPTDTTLEPLGSIVPEVGAASTPYGSKYTWSQGQSYKFIGLKWGGFGIPRVCFLTKVSGKFTGNSEEVGVYPLFDGWVLGGKSSSAGVGAEAYCMLVADFTSEYNWSGGSSVTINNATPSLCFLTRVGGEFSAYDYVSVIRKKPSANWSLEGYGGGGNSTAVKGSARCAHTLQGNNAEVATGSWDGGQYASLAPTKGTVCVFTTVGGALQSASSYVEIRKHADWWLLVGSPTNVATSPKGGSHCYS